MNSIEVMISTDEDGADEINRVVGSHGGEPGTVTQPKDFGGAAETIVAVSILVKALPPLIDAIRRLIESGRLKALTVGDVTIPNPTPDAAEQLLLERVHG